MSCYLLPQNIINDMTTSIRCYWWSGKADKRGWHMLPWDTVCLPKAAGGIGFRGLHHFNVALLGKQICRLVCEPDNLLSQVYKCKYYPSGSIFEYDRTQRSSFAWKGLSIAFSKLRDDFFKRPGISIQVQIHFDKWGGS